MRELLAELNSALARRLPCVYCAVVETRGSTPQKAGAAMLVYPDGTQAGTLGGGCVEAEVKRRALLGLNDTGRPEVLTFFLDDDYGWDDGLICGGRMTILAQPLTSGGPLLDRAAPYHQSLSDPPAARRPAPRPRRPLLPVALRPRRPRRRLHRGGRNRRRPRPSRGGPLSFRCRRRVGDTPGRSAGVGEGEGAPRAAFVAAEAGDATRRRVPAGASACHSPTGRWRARRAGGRAAG